MPLLVLTGLPSSGKTTLASLIREHMAKAGVTDMHTVTDEGVSGFSRSDYSNSNKEKDLRGYLRSEVQRLLSQDALVIVDSLNYIKGYRYELYCLAKAAKTTYAVVQSIVNGETAREFNKNKAVASDRYDDGILTELVMRYECPEGRNRWDSPLFTFSPNMTQDESSTLLNDIYQSLYGGRRLTPNHSTQNVPLANSSFLQELDTISQEIIQLIFVAQQTAEPGDKIHVPNTTDKIDFRGRRSMAELARLKRQYMAYVRTRPRIAQEYADEGKPLLYRLFVNFVNHNVL